MAEDDDESFGDFTFASFPPNPTVHVQINAPQPTNTADNNEEDDEWGDFLDHSRGSGPSNPPSQPKPFDPFAFSPNHGSQQSSSLSEPATSQSELSKTSQWVKPRGALPLSLFGETEDEEKPDEEEKCVHIETQIAKEETKKLNNRSNTELSIGFNDILANLYNQNSQFQSGIPSSNAREYDNLSSNLDVSELDRNSGSLAVKKDSGTAHNFDWNLTGAESKSQGVESNYMGWSTDLNKSFSNQTGFSSNTSVDVTSTSDHGELIKCDDKVLGLKTGGLSSNITASQSSFSGWDFGFGELESTLKTSNSSFNGLNSNSGVICVSEKPGSKNGDADCDDDDDDDDGWEFKDASTEARDGGTNNKAGPEAQEIHKTESYSAGISNGSDRLLDLFPMSNGSEEADSHAHNTGDVKAYSFGIDNVSNSVKLHSVGTDIGSNGSLQSDLKGYDTSNIMVYSYGLRNVSDHSIDLFSMSNGTDIEGHDIGDMAFSSGFSNGSALTNESIKAKPEAHDTDDLKANLSGYSESANHSIDLFALSNGSIDFFANENGVSGIIHENEVENNKPSTSAQNSFIPDSYWASEKSVNNGVSDLKPAFEGAESDEDFGDFTAASSDSGSKQEVNMTRSNSKEALPLSIFGDEELETNATSTIEDDCMRYLASFPKSDKKLKPVISIDDIISSLYSHAEQNTSISSSQNLSDVLKPPDSGANSNLVNDEDAFGDESWEFKDALPQITGNETSAFNNGDPLPSNLSSRKLDNYVDFYSELKKELCLHSKYHLGNLKGDSKELDHESYIHEGDNLEDHPSWETCVQEFIEALKNPKFQVLESEYKLSRRLSQIGNDFNSAAELISHACIMLNLLTFASAKEQLIYVSAWYEMISVCTKELQHGAWLLKQVSDKDAQSCVFSDTRGRKYILGLVEIYKVAIVLGASVKLYQPWSWLNSVDFTGIYSLLDECHALWSRCGLAQAISSISDRESTSTLGSCLDNFKSILDLDAFALQDHIFSQKEVMCRLSLLTPEAVHGMKLVIWNGEHYFITLANLWTNLISNDPPELPHLSFWQ